MSTLKLRKFFAAFTLTTLVASLFVVAPATQAAPPSWWTEGTELLDQVDPMYGNENQVEADKCRVSAVLTAALGLEENPSATEGYIDIPAECEGVAGAMIAADIIKGEANSGEIFGAGITINRAVFATMLSRAFNLDEAYPNATLSASAEADLENVDWAKPYYAQVMTAGIYKQTRPGDTINIYEITTAVDRAMNPGSTGGSDNNGDGGDLEITISDNTPQSRTVPGGVQNAHIATFELEANNDDVNVTSIRFSKGGIADDGALTAVALFTEDGTRVSKARSFNSSTDTATVNFLSGGLTVEGGESMELLVFGQVGSVDLNSDLISDQFFVQIQSSNDVVSNASTVAVSDARSETMTIGSADAAELELSQGSSTPDVSIGEQGVEVFNFEMENNSTDNTDIVFYGITLEAEGTFDEDEDLMNYELYLDGDMVASTEMGRNGYVSFLVEDADGYVVEDSKNIEVEVRADIMGGAGETISFDVDSELDVLAADASFGTGAKIVIPTGGNAISSNSTNIEAGELTLVAIDPETDEFTQDTDEFVLGTIRVTSNAGQNIELKELAVDIIADLTDVDSTTAGAQQDVEDVLENVEAVTPFGTYSLDQVAAGTTEKYEDDQIDLLLPAGESFDIVITADIKDNLSGLVSTDEIELALPTINGTEGTSYFYAEETDDDTPVTDITPSSLSFDPINGSVASLEVVALTQSDKTVVVGSKDVVAMNFEMEAADAEDITVNDIQVDVIWDEDGAGGTAATEASNQQVSRLALYMDSVEEGNLLDSKGGSKLSSGSVEFDDLDMVVPAGETHEFFIVIDVVDNVDLASGTLDMEIDSVDADDSDNDTAIVYNSGGTDLDDPTTTVESSTRTITLAATGTLSVTADTTDPVANRDRLVLGGETSDFIASWEVVAVNEDIVLKDITLEEQDDTISLSDGVSEVQLYADDKTTMIASESVPSLGVAADDIVFEDVNYVVEEGSENLYVKVVAHPIGLDKAGTTSTVGGADGTGEVVDYEFALGVSDAEGQSSGNEVAAVAAVANANGFAVVPVKVSGLSFVDSYEGTQVASTLNNGNNIIGILKVDNANHSNTDSATGASLETVLREMNPLVQHYTNETDAGTAITEFYIERLDINSDGKVALNASLAATAANDNVNFDLDTELTNDKFIEKGDVAYYAISADITKDATNDNDDFVQLVLDNFRSETPNGEESLIYSSDESTGPEWIDIARLKTTRIEAKQVSETN